MHHLLISALANERRKTLLAEAEQARRIRQARRSGTLSPTPDPRAGRRGLIARHGRPAATAENLPREPVQLVDGPCVIVCPIRPADAAVLFDAFGRLGVASRHGRYLGSKRTLSRAELRHLTVVDHRELEALIAISSASVLDRAATRPACIVAFPLCRAPERAPTLAANASSFRPPIAERTVQQEGRRNPRSPTSSWSGRVSGRRRPQ